MPRVTVWQLCLRPWRRARGIGRQCVFTISHRKRTAGNHHIFLDILDPATAPNPASPGGRVYGTRARITWDGGEQIVTIDKPLNEPGTNCPMWKWQVCDVIALGRPGEELPSDRVTGMHTGHPDEARGNTLFHHSFSVTFLKVQKPDVISADSVIYGTIHNAAGRTAQLLSAETVIASQMVTAAETFRFTDLGAGEYTVAVAGAPLRSTPVRVNGQDQAHLDLTLVLAESAISGRVRNGAGRTLWLSRDGTQIATQWSRRMKPIGSKSWSQGRITSRWLGRRQYRRRSH